MGKKSLLIRFTAIQLTVLILFSSCASTTLIQTKPNGAKVYIDDEYKGLTPYKYKDSKIVGSTTNLRLEKENYQTKNTYFDKNEEISIGPLIGGLFFLVPFLWVMKYKPTHTYELKPLSEKKMISHNNEKVSNKAMTKAEKLYELKKLLDDKIITQEEFNSEKKKILNNDNF